MGSQGAVWRGVLSASVTRRVVALAVLLAVVPVGPGVVSAQTSGFPDPVVIAEVADSAQFSNAIMSVSGSGSRVLLQNTSATYSVNVATGDVVELPPTFVSSIGEDSRLIYRDVDETGEALVAEADTAPGECGPNKVSERIVTAPLTDAGAFSQQSFEIAAYSIFTTAFLSSIYVTPKPLLGGSSSSLPQPDFSNPANSPGPGWQWRGNGPPGSPYGAWYNPVTRESLHPDLLHPPPIGPHYDWIAPGGARFRLFPDGSVVPK